MVVSKACNQFLSHCRSAISLSEHSLRAYGSDLKDVEKYFGPKRQIGGIDKEDLRQYIRHLREERKFKETSIKRRLASMKLLFRWALQEAIVISNPFDSLNERIRLPKRLPRALDRNDAGLLRRAIIRSVRKDGFDALCRKTAIHLLLDTGIRVGELSSIRFDELSLSDRCLTIQGKGNRQRLVYLLAAPLHRALERYVLNRQKIATVHDHLFVTETGMPMTPQKMRNSLREVAALAGIDRHVTPHMLRHTCATHWLESGLDIRYVQKLLGHQSISTTEIYTHVSDQGLREALLKSIGGQMR